jgi:hypothetical protein
MWSDMTEKQKLMKRKQWKIEDKFYYRYREVDPIRKAFMDDWRECSSGVEIWSPM